MTSQLGADRRRDIDGLRGVAILGVLLHHIYPSLASGGFVGVDVFFTLSGYLITSIILRDVAAHRFSFLHFYARRAKRLAPAAVAMVAGVFGLAMAFFMPQELSELGSSAVAFAAMVSNVFFWRHSNYFAAQDAPWPLLHTWSLSIEEQFYLLYPLLLTFFARARCGWRRPVAAAAVASFAGSCFLATNDPTAAYYSPLSRAWELLAGAVIAGAPAPRLNRLARNVTEPLCLAAIIAPMLMYDERTPFPGLAAAVPALGTAGLIWLGSAGDSGWRRLTSLQPLVWLGLISYSLYLWHWPLIVFARYHWSHEPATYPAWVSAAAAGVAIVIAWASYRWIETPWREARIRDSFTVLGAVACSAFVLGLGITAHRLQGLPNRMPPRVQALLAASRDVSPRRAETMHATTASIVAGKLPLLGVRDPAAAPAFALWGDSQADALVPVFDELARQRAITGVALTRGATAPLPIDNVQITQRSPYASDPDFTRAAAEQITKRRIPVVILAALWSGYLQYDIRVDGKQLMALQEKREAIASTLTRTIELLRRNGVQTIWLVLEVPVQPFHVPRSLGLHSLRSLPFPRGLSRADYDARSGELDRLLSGLNGGGVHVIDLASPILENRHGLLTAEGKPLYSDWSHLSVTGAWWLSDFIAPIFTAITP